MTDILRAPDGTPMAPILFTRADGHPAVGMTHPENVAEGTAGSIPGVSFPAPDGAAR